MSSEPPPPTLSVTHQRPRPSVAWWIGGALLMVGGVLVGIGLVVNVFVTMFQTEAHVSSDGSVEELHLEADRDYLLWMDEDDHIRPRCLVVETSTGQRVEIHGMGSSRFSRNDQSAEGWFSSGSGNLSITCSDPQGMSLALATGPVEIGPRPDAPDWLGGIVGSIAIPILMVLAGVAVLVVTGIRLAASKRP